MAYVLAVTWVAKPGHEAEVKEILQTLGEASRREEGVITYTTHVDPENPAEFFIYEKYHDASGLEAHQATTHFKEFVLEKAIPLLESRVRRQYNDF
ncbi:MAG: antibiotic biosynthesis monooxygenase [Gammaproteobacteria bacterium]|nr:antibiotic biosynthesis monooxygenase [Gammaproteobacteria bacterium]MDH3535943.1 antibiotic biosynthesis monooxygenase [Gammaproteobacteria bacterium]